MNEYKFASAPRYDAYEGMGLTEIAISGQEQRRQVVAHQQPFGPKKPGQGQRHAGQDALDQRVSHINDDFHLMDLPGYGFARVAKDEQRRWAAMMEGYFADSGLLKHVLHLVDIRHKPTQDDRDMNAFLRQTGIPFTVVATKADKISRAQRARQVHAICRTLQVQPWEVIPYSSEDGTGRDAVLSLFDRVCGQAGDDDAPAEGMQGEGATAYVKPERGRKIKTF